LTAWSSNSTQKERRQVKTASVLAALAALAVALVPPAGARKEAAKRRDPAAGVQLELLLDRISHHRDETWKWQRVMQQPLTRYAASAEKVRSVRYRQWVMRLWTRRALTARERALNPPHKAEWLCIHRHEGEWTDPNAPYYGGLQMDREFQATYAPKLVRRKGTADHWTPLEQMWVAERAFKTRGFWPWPNTARYCGLI
jgi:hypothetical protein